MKVLISGSNGYIGRHVTDLFRESRSEVYVYDRRQSAIICPDGIYERCSAFEGYFDVVINCARPHWSEYSPSEIANIESKLLLQLNHFAKAGAIKIHTSGVWLFGKDFTKTDVTANRHDERWPIIAVEKLAGCRINDPVLPEYVDKPVVDTARCYLRVAVLALQSSCE